MKFQYLSACLASLAAVSNVNAAPHKDPEAIATKQINQMDAKYKQYIQDTIKTRKTGCTSKNIIKRQEWGSLSKPERKSYIDAVYCLQKKAPQGRNKGIPGSQSRFDDFAGTHIQQAPFVHFSGLFFHFHRYFVWLYEKALREECGYKGAQPYWDWTLSWKDPSKSTVFDGSPYSLGSNGKKVPHGPTTIRAYGIVMDIPPGTGGGCVEKGPFSQDKYTLSLGPNVFEPYGPDGGLGYNPRCLKRDLNPYWTNNTRPAKVLEALTACQDIGCFDTIVESLDGTHAGGHFGQGGMGLDTFASPGDPAFWLHHGQVDRMWSLWQGQNPRNRTLQTAQTGTAFNNPPSANVTLNTLVDAGIVGEKKSVKDVSSTIDGPFCYMYV
ncbi:hypothetical protein QBC37DRAFT_419802 [Rhypophila decipiens]|uniref:Tyrosinase copper-binding domain-containing protein n=1 Tax=Rhypophila decipiens TaxID=261697 RepID=A0AAN7B992_9PEZI|nr:hypothetical protein QBC37DRAFT_419802 [Rhypophila decipiens]